MFSDHGPPLSASIVLTNVCFDVIWCGGSSVTEILQSTATSAADYGQPKTHAQEVTGWQDMSC